LDIRADLVTVAVVHRRRRKRRVDRRHYFTLFRSTLAACTASGDAAVASTRSQYWRMSERSTRESTGSRLWIFASISTHARKRSASSSSTRMENCGCPVLLSLVRLTWPDAVTLVPILAVSFL